MTVRGRPPNPVNLGLPHELRVGMHSVKSNLHPLWPEDERMALGFVETIRSMEEHDFEVRKAALVERARRERGDKMAADVARITWPDVQAMPKLKQRARDLGLIK